MRRMAWVVLSAFGCAHQPQTPADAAVQATHRFAADLYGQVRQGQGNRVFSPLSVHTALSMAAAGARGETEAQMWRVLRNAPDRSLAHRSLGTLLRQNNAPAADTKLKVLNRIYGERSFSFEPSFLQRLEADYAATLTAVDFFGAAPQATAEINAWVEETTEGKIQRLVPAGGVGRCTRLVLVNAVYFLGHWAAPFRAEATRPEPFFSADGRSDDIPTMVQTGNFRYREHGDAQILELPYRDRQNSMVILLPRERDGLARLEADVVEDGFSDYMTTEEATRVEVHLPKFEFTTATDVVPALERLGMRAAFDPAQADFSGVGRSEAPDGCDKPLAIDDIFHKAFVAVDELGTEAAAATAIALIELTSAGPPEPEPILFRADHPFLFVLKDGSGAALFVGRVDHLPTSG